MGIDTSIYNSIQPVKFDLPSPVDAAQKAMSLSQLGMQQRQAQLQMQTMMAQRQAMSAAVDPQTGKLDQGAYLSNIGKVAPWMLPGETERLAQVNEAQAKASAAKSDAESKAVGVALPYLENFDSAPDNQKPAMFNTMVKTLADKGMPIQNVPTTWDPVAGPKWLANTMATIKQTPAYLAQQQALGGIGETKAKTAEALSNVATAPAKLNSELYGSRSPNAELSSQYTGDVKGLRVSQVNMQQMLDAYKTKPGPQADASMLLNALRIKNPNVPDVNSLEEMSTSQAVPDRWRQYASKALQGGLDQNTKDNILRDAMSTYRANMDSLGGIQKRYQARAQVQNVNDPTLTYEPAMEQTAKEATALQGKLGPYVPPTQRGGSILGSAAQMIGLGGEKSANAADTAQSKYRPSGSTVSGDQVDQYATKHGLTRTAAQKYLKGHGYVIGN